MTWMALLFYWIESLSSRLDGLHMLALPAAALCAAVPVIWPGRHDIGNADNLLFRAHFVMAMTAYSLWEMGHNTAHHGFNNLKGRDQVWAPYSKAEFDALLEPCAALPRADDAERRADGAADPQLPAGT